MVLGIFTVLISLWKTDIKRFSHITSIVCKDVVKFIHNTVFYAYLLKQICYSLPGVRTFEPE